MKFSCSFGALVASVVIGSTALMPVAATAQSERDRAYHHRQQTKNTWRNVAIGSGALGLYGLLKGDTALTVAGAAGALYSANRYEQDRRGQSRIGRRRAEFYSRRSFDYKGHHYVRRTVHRNGRTYYRFERD